MLEKIRKEKLTFPNYLDKLPTVGREREDNFKNLTAFIGGCLKDKRPDQTS